MNHLKSKIKDYENIINLLENQLKDKNNIIQKYINSINSNQINNQMNITSIKPFEKIMSINFVSMGNQDISNYSLVCKNTDLFVKLEQMLNNEFPYLKEQEPYFLVNGGRIKRFKTLDENGIKNNDIISIFLIDE